MFKVIEKLYTVEEVAELASVTGRTIRNYLKSGRLVGRKIGGQWRFPESEVQRLLTGASSEEEEAQTAPAPSLSYVPALDLSPSAIGHTLPNEPDNTYADEYAQQADGFGDNINEYASAPSPAPQEPAYSYGSYAEPARLPTPNLPPMPRPQAPVSSSDYSDAPSAAGTQATPYREAVLHLATAPPPPNAPIPEPTSATEAYTSSAPLHPAPVYATVQPERPPVSQPAPARPPVQHAPPMQTPPPVQQTQAAQPSRPVLVQQPVAQPQPSFQQAPAPQPPLAYYEPEPAQPAYRYEAPASQTQAVQHETRYEQQAPQPAYALPVPQQAAPAPPQQSYPVYAQPQQPAQAPQNYASAPPQAPVLPTPAASQPVYAPPQQPVSYEPPPAAAAVPPQAPTYAPYPQTVQLPFYAGIIPTAGYYAPQQPMQPPAAPVSLGQEPAQAEHSATSRAKKAPEEERPAGAPELSDVARRVTRFVSEVHDCTHGPVLCAVIDLHQSLAAARVTSERLADIASQESETGMLCQSFVEFDERYYIARFSLFGTSNFLFRCLKLIG